MNMYLAAMLVPLIATLLAYLVQLIIPTNNISLVYLTAVLILATKTHTKPALLCAIASFFAYNFFFTEPRYSLVMTQTDEILTVLFFLLLAAVTGQLTARLSEQLNSIRERESLAKLQLIFTEKLMQTINKAEVLQILYQYLSEITSEKVMAVYYQDEKIRFEYGSASLLDSEISAIKTATLTGHPTGKNTNNSSDIKYYFYPLPMDNQKTLVIGMEFKNDVFSITDKSNLSVHLIQQAILAFERIQLTIELEQEKIYKEHELLRSTLLSSVSHDLKTPLSAMIGATTSLIELESSLNLEQKKELLESILVESQRLDHYIQNLLDMTRLGRGELSLSRDWVAVDDILNVVMKRIYKLQHQHNINIHIEENIPLLWVHSALIEQAIFNILENAIKYTPEFTCIEISVVRAGGKNGVSILISDRGYGVPENEQEKIFDMFHTIRHGDRHTGGTGLGLTISKGILNAHGGDVTLVNDKLKKGATFQIYLPETGVIDVKDLN